MEPVADMPEQRSKYINRDLSWLEFNRRVLQEAQEESTPLLERAKFLAIVSNNLDEFMSVRVSGIVDQVKAGVSREDFSGYKPEELLDLIWRKSEKLVTEQYAAYRRINDLLAEAGIRFTEWNDLTPNQQKYLERYYYDKVMPILTPMAIDQSRPFPLVHTLSLYFAVVLRRDGEDEHNAPCFALLQIPSILSRCVEVWPGETEQERQFILLEDVIKAHIHTLFNGYVPAAAPIFRVTRNADLPLDEEGVDLLDEVEKTVRRRKWGAPVRLEIEKAFPSSALGMLQEQLQLEHNLVTADGPVDLSFLMSFSNALKGYDDLRHPKHQPSYPREFAGTDDFFSVLGRQDVLVMHPYESFAAVNDFFRHAADDPAVLAIKTTLYRVSGQSHIVRSLVRAAENGKQVTVIVELKARFDEERNIGWAKKLEKAGCHVVYGLVGLKIHAKMTLIVRQETERLTRYVHISTGNYNGKTAKLYTDIGLFTSHSALGEDIAALFNEITGFSAPRPWHCICVAPANLRSSLIAYIQREMRHAGSGKPAKIIAKMNALSDPGLIDQLYEASRAGVKIDLIVRGICCLRPGIDGLSQNIAVRSIVDRFLEHSRVFYFENAGSPEVWLASADWMTRNLFRRIEFMCPILDEKLERVIVAYLLLLLNDNVKARLLLPDGSYKTAEQDAPATRSQFEMQEFIKIKYGLSTTAAHYVEHGAMLDGDFDRPVVYH